VKTSLDKNIRSLTQQRQSLCSRVLVDWTWNQIYPKHSPYAGENIFPSKQQQDVYEFYIHFIQNLLNNKTCHSTKIIENIFVGTLQYWVQCHDCPSIDPQQVRYEAPQEQFIDITVVTT
jgi:uncharacterized UBP type Zn finger protein